MGLYDKYKTEATAAPTIKYADIVDSYKPKEPTSISDIHSWINKIKEAGKSYVKWVGEFDQWLLTGAMRWVGGLARIGWGALDLLAENNPLTLWINALTGTKYKSDFGKSMQNMVETWAKGIENFTQKFWLNPESMSSKVGWFTGETLSTLPAGEWAVNLWMKVAKPLIAPIAKSVKWLVKSEDLIGNLFQPNEAQSGLLKPATNAIKHLIKYAPENVQTKLANAKNFEEVGQVFQEYGTQIYKNKVLPALKQSTKTVKDANINDALKWLSDIYKSGVWDTFRADKKELATLIKNYAKNNGLTAQEITRLKTLHTQANELFTAKGIEKGGFSSTQLWDVRSALKKLVEKVVKKDTWVNIEKPNSLYGAFQDARNLIEQQSKWATALKPTYSTPWRTGKIAQKISELPAVEEGINVVRWATWKLFNSIKAGKINAAEVEKNLPNLIKRIIETIRNETSSPNAIVKPWLTRRIAGWGVSAVSNFLNDLTK